VTAEAVERYPLGVGSLVEDERHEQHRHAGQDAFLDSSEPAVQDGE